MNNIKKQSDVIFTHEINYFGKILKCHYYRNIKDQNGNSYIRTDDGRLMWFKTSMMKKLI